MKKRLPMKFLQALAVAAALIILFSSCGGVPRQEPESSAPATGGNASVSPALSSAAPAPSPSLATLPPIPSENLSKIPAEWNDDGIFSDCYEQAYTLLETMTPEEKVAQLLLGHCPRTDAESFIQKYQPGGFVLFGADFRGKTADQVIRMIEAFQTASKIPMIMATDEEGGSVVRISRNVNLSTYIFRSPQKLFSNGGLDAVREDALTKAALLKMLGLNLILAPVADVSTDPADYMFSRTFGQPAPETGAYVAAVVSAMREMNVSSSLKHFPGYGDNPDTHKVAAVDKRPYNTFTESDFIPFEKGIAAGAETVMVSHNIITCMEAGVPASLSQAVHEILRDELKFTGIIMTDDLGMSAVKTYEGNADRYVLAVLAGNDMLIVSNYEGAFTSIQAAVRSGEIPVNTIDSAVFRILSWKLHGGIISGFEG